MTTATLHTTMGDIIVELFLITHQRPLLTLSSLQPVHANGLTHALAKNQLPISTTALSFTASLMVS